MIELNSFLSQRHHFQRIFWVVSKEWIFGLLATTLDSWHGNGKQSVKSVSVSESLFELNNILYSYVFYHEFDQALKASCWNSPD